MILVRHKKKEFVRLFYGLKAFCEGHAYSDYEGFYEIECEERELEKARNLIKKHFDDEILTISDFNDLNKQLDEELENLE